MSNIEKKAIGIIKDHLDIFFIIVISILGFVIRFSGRDFISYDMEACLIPWFEQIYENGGIRGLDVQVGNYNVAYQTIIAILTYLPFGNVYGYKIVSCIFDYLLAATGFFIGKIIGKTSWKSCLIYGLILLHPTSFLNSAFWGQCDSIYAFWCLLTILFLCNNRITVSMLTYGIAISFKLQAIFLFPFIVFMYVYEKRYSIMKFIWIAAGFFITAIPALASGKPLFGLFDVYAEQAHTDARLYLNWPSMWRILTTEEYSGYDIQRPMAILFTIGILTALYFALLQSRIVLDAKNILNVAIVTVYTCAIFLPSMHERYNYLTVMMAAIMLLFDFKTFPLFAFMSLIELSIYGLSLFESDINLSLLAWINVCTYIGYLLLLFPDSIRNLANRD